MRLAAAPAHKVLCRRHSAGILATVAISCRPMPQNPPPKANTSNLRELAKLAAPIRKARLGKLADFPLFDKIATVWLAHNRGPLWDEEDILDKRTLAAYEKVLRLALAEFVKQNDLDGLQCVVDSVRLLQEQPRRPKARIAPADELHFEILRAMRAMRGMAGAKPPTIDELLRWLKRERNCNVEEKTLRRVCKKLNLHYSPAKVGRPRKHKK